MLNALLGRDGILLQSSSCQKYSLLAQDIQRVFHAEPSTPKTAHMIDWERPQSGFFKLNVDGSRQGNDPRTGLW